MHRTRRHPTARIGRGAGGHAPPLPQPRRNGGKRWHGGRRVAHLGCAVAGVPLPQHAPQRARTPRQRGRPGRRAPRHGGPRALHGHRDREVRPPSIGLQPAPARRLPQPHAGRPPPRHRLPAGGVLRLPHRRDHRGRRHPIRLMAEDEGHPRGAAHVELRRLPRAVRRRIECGGAGRIGRRLPSRRLPLLSGLHRRFAIPRHAPCLVPSPRSRVGRLSGVALPRLLPRADEVRPAGHAAPARAHGRATARPPLLERGHAEPGSRRVIPVST